MEHVLPVVSSKSLLTATTSDMCALLLTILPLMAWQKEQYRLLSWAAQWYVADKIVMISVPLQTRT